MGHLIPLTEFAKRLILTYDFSVTFIIPNFGYPMKAQKSFLDSLTETINVVYLPPVSFDTSLSDVGPEIHVPVSMTRVPALRDSLSLCLASGLKVLTESNHLVALVVDVVSTDAFDVAKVFCLLRYIFIPLCAMSLSLFLHLSKLDETGISNYRDLPEPVQIPGCVAIKGTELPETFQNRNSESYKLALYHTKRYNLADGIIINSFIDLESKTFKVLMETGSGKSPVYPIGPLLQTGPTSGGGSGYECLRWLDEQPRGSVLFVSFGSSGTHTHEQLTELALGLEMSEQRFIWVVRSPAKNASWSAPNCLATLCRARNAYREEGKLVRHRAKALKDAAAMATSQHGSSTMSLAQVNQIWKNHKTTPSS
ncbi:hypothetical protein HYC85_002916 [Camellia sinensis]|uniref:UDP-glycosyltransferases domain-containing protein n=1 Tax=Camellia sinensis TaxID=4442 RepID=A0A7J7IAU3_CAMSI|nr:hypothetical protein HYC85_002916 [Camellia sinensis]